jgi:deoxyadenosine/deoxycytidine kinase
LRRGLDFEQLPSTWSTSDALADGYAEFFHYYDQAPVLIVDAAEIDFADNPAHIAMPCWSKYVHMEGTRQFFNPHPMLLL